MDEVELRRAFEARDIDGDGLLRYRPLSLSDLRESTGLSTSELLAVFAACQGPLGNRDYLTFQEFAAGFRQFPRDAGSPSPRRTKLHIEIEGIEESLRENRDIDRLITACNELKMTLGGTVEANMSISPSVALDSLASLFLTPKAVTLPPAPICEQFSSVLSASSAIIAAQSEELDKMRQLFEEEANWNEAIQREYEAVKKTCRLLTEKTREFEAEWHSSSVHSESQNEHLRRELEIVRCEEKQSCQRLDDVHNLLQEKEVQISELQRELHSLSRRRPLPAPPLAIKEDAPSPRVPQTSRAALKFLFSPLPSPAKTHSFQDLLRQRQLEAFRQREKDVELREQRIDCREREIEQAWAVTYPPCPLIYIYAAVNPHQMCQIPARKRRTSSTITP